MTKRLHTLLLPIALSGLFLAALPSCKTKRPTDSGITEPAGGKIETAQELLQKIKENTPVYRTLNIRFSAKVKTAKNENSLRGKLKIRNDSCVWVSALPFGIEAFRLLATQNETALLSYLDKKYFRGGYDLLSAQLGYPVDYALLQASLTGIPDFRADKNTYRLDDDRNGYFFSPYDKNRFERITEGKEFPADGAATVHALWFDAKSVRLTKNVVYDVAQKRYLEIRYDVPVTVGNQVFPSVISIDVKSPKETLSANIEYNKIETDLPDMEYPFTVPASYEPMGPK